MSSYVEIHPKNPQPRLIEQVAACLRQGGVVIYPTDSGYALGCGIGEKKAVERIRRLRALDEKHPMTLVCADLSSIGTYAKVDNSAFRLLKAHTPGPYTFILEATNEVPRLLLHPKRRAIGIRVPDHPITSALIAAEGAPLISVTLIPDGKDDPLTDPEEIRDHFSGQVDMIVHGGPGSLQPTTVVDLRTLPPEIMRVGKGDPSPFN